MWSPDWPEYSGAAELRPMRGTLEMRLAIQTSRLPGESLVEKFANASAFGFDAVEVAIGPTFDLAEHLAEVKSASNSSGIPVSAICTHSIHDPLMPDPALRKERFTGLG